MSMIANALAQFDESAQAIASVKEYAAFTVAVDGIGKVTEARKQVKRLRVDIEKRRKELNEGALTYQRAINSEAKRLTAEIEPIEEKLKAEEDAYEAEREAEKKAKERIKQMRLQQRLNDLGHAGVVVTDVAAVEAMDDTEFQFFLMRESGKAEQRRKEEEQARREAEEFAAQQRKEREELAAKLKAEREAMEAERAELRRQQEELQRQQAEARRQEDERRAAELKAQQEAERQAREAALAPEREKAIKFTQSLHACAVAGLESLGNPYWGEEAMVRVRQACKLIVDAVER